MDIGDTDSFGLVTRKPSFPRGVHTTTTLTALTGGHVGGSYGVVTRKPSLQRGCSHLLP